MKIYTDAIKAGGELLIRKSSILIEPGAMTSITGENGCGKSLLLRRLFLACRKEEIPAVFVEQGNDYFWMGSDVVSNISLSESEADCQRALALLSELFVLLGMTLKKQQIVQSQ